MAGKSGSGTFGVPENGTHRVLVVEDSALVAAELVMVLEDAGFAVVGPASSAREARELIAGTTVDAAVLDIDLGARAERDGAALADLLCDLGVPFIFVSGQARETLDPGLRAFAHLSKPVTPDALIQQLKAHLGDGRG